MKVWRIHRKLLILAFSAQLSDTPFKSKWNRGAILCSRSSWKSCYKVWFSNFVLIFDLCKNLTLSIYALHECWNLESCFSASFSNANLISTRRSKRSLSEWYATYSIVWKRQNNDVFEILNLFATIFLLSACFIFWIFSIWAHFKHLAIKRVCSLSSPSATNSSIESEIETTF